jgi:hypothetical protein
MDGPGETTVKYIIMMFGDQASMLERRSLAWAREMVDFMHKLNDDLTRAGELASAEGLADATQAKSVHFRNGMSVVTDGPFAESKESLAGYWIVDVENEARALEIAKRVVAFTEGPIEVRQIMDQPPNFDD